MDSEHLRRLLEEQRIQSARIESALAELEGADFLRENARLREENGELRGEAERLRGEAARLHEENRALEEALRGQMLRRRDGMLGASQKEAEALFGREENAAVNRLAARGAAIRQRLAALRASLEREEGEAAGALLQKVAALEGETRAYMRAMSLRVREGFDTQKAQASREFEDLRTPLTPRQVQGNVHKNSLEMLFGGRIYVVIGALFILLAVVFGLRYTYLYLLRSDLVKGLLAYLLGAVFVAGAELLGRRQRSAFSTGICAGGIAILFASTAVSYFSLGILSVPVAVGICIATAALALLQSLRWNAQIIAIFALIGGYLPMTALDDAPAAVIGAMVYFLLLGLFVLLAALRRRWQVLKFFSLSLSLVGMWYLQYLLAYAMLPGIVYTVAVFLLYLVIVLGYPVLRREPLRVGDTVLLGIATACTCGTLFALLDTNGYGAVSGVVALGFCAVFFLLARWMKAALERDAGARGLFYATSFAFWVLMIPLHFDAGLITLGWMIEGVALFVFGTLTDRLWYRRAGGAISLLCFAWFLLYEVPGGGSGSFLWKYGAVTLGAVVLFAVALYRHWGEPAYWNSGEGRGVRVLQACALINVWLFLLYCARRVCETLSPTFALERWWTLFLFAALTLGCGALYRGLTVLHDRPTRLIAHILAALGLVLTLCAAQPIIPDLPGRPGAWAGALAALLLLCAAAVLALWDQARWLGRERGLSREWIALLPCVYGLLLAVVLLLAHAGLSPRSIYISLLLLAWAFGAVAAGFVCRLGYLRRCGLALSLLAILKLCLLDLYFLSSGQRILSYFLFGVAFIAISFVYHQFSKRLVPASLAEEADGDARDAQTHEGGQDM